VTNVTEDQIPDPSGSGDLIDVFDITYKVVGRPGQFTVQIPQSPDPVTAAYEAMVAATAEIQAIYGGSSG
jgi:hypothetical protein